MELLRQRDRHGQIVPPNGAKLDPRRCAYRQPADGSFGIAQAHRPVKSGVRFSMKAAIPSLWSSDANRR